MNHKLDTDTQVFFYEQDFYVLSNFSAFCIHWRGQAHFTSEHAYHWARFDLPEGRGVLLQDCVTRAPSAHAAFKFAQENKTKQREDWDDIKVSVMRDILHAKDGRGRIREMDARLSRWELEKRERWRALALCIKAKLESVSSGIVSFDEEFMAQIVLPNGRTMSEHATPLITRAYESGTMPPMLEHLA